MKPFFSIIIPTLNEEKYLPKLLSSLLRQKERDFEIIVVDGKSEDETFKVAWGFEQAFSKISVPLKIIECSRHNVSYQRNLGAKKARGEWLAFFDADVWFDKNYLFQIKEKIEEKGLSFLTSWNKSETRKKEDEILVMFNNASIETSVIIGKPVIPGYCFIVKKEIFKKIGGFNEDLSIAEDYELACRIYEQGFIPQVLPKPKISVSFRRYRKEGRLKVLGKYARVAVNVLLRGNHVLKNKLIDYPMGGKAHE